MTATKCNTCGGEDFFTDAGYFYCVECQTQSQDIREEVYDEFFTGQRGIVRTIKKSSVLPTGPRITGKQSELTSWEIFNYVLKGLVDEVIQIGSKREVKITAIQLWATYLYKLEVAFTSSNISRKPKLSLTFKPKDAEIIYGVTKQRLRTNSLMRRSPKRKRRLSESSGSESSGVSVLSKRASAKKAALAKKALVAAEYEQTFSTTDNDNISIDMSNQTLENLGTPSEHSGSTKSHRLKLTKQAKTILKEASAKMNEITQEDSRTSFRRKVFRGQITDVTNITLGKIVALVGLALLFSKENIFIGDLLRWIDEGHLSVNNCEKLIPEDVTIPAETQRVLDAHCITYSGQHSTMISVCSALNISELPVPDLCHLAARYCQELQLPDEFAKAVQAWIAYTPKQLIKKDTKHEARTMAYIVVLLKMLFSVDDMTECKISELASDVNRSVARQGETTLFVWNDWVQYIECRKSVVSDFHYVTRHSVYKDRPGMNHQLFIEHYERTMFKKSVPLNAGTSEEWRNAVRRTLNQLDSFDTNPRPVTDVIQFPPTLTPLFTYCQILTTKYSNKLSEINRNILAQDFTKNSMNFLFNSKSSISIGVQCDIDILPQAGIANTCIVEQVKECKKNIENSNCNTKTIQVQIIDKPIKNVEKQFVQQTTSDKEIKEITNDLSEIVSDDSSEEDEDFDDSTVLEDVSAIPSINLSKNTLRLFEARSMYWVCHKKFSSNDDFDSFAAKMFPTSFLWLLKECARVVGSTIRELYEEVMFVETKKNTFTKSNQYIRTRKKYSL